MSYMVNGVYIHTCVRACVHAYIHLHTHTYMEREIWRHALDCIGTFNFPLLMSLSLSLYIYVHTHTYESLYRSSHLVI